MKRSPRMSTSDILNFQSALHKEWWSLPGWISRELSIWWKRVSSFFCLLSVASCTLWVLFHFPLKHFLFVCHVGVGPFGGGRSVLQGSGSLEWLEAVPKQTECTEATGRLFIKRTNASRRYLIQIQREVHSL